ncbi:MAG: hypothetical protein KDI52_07450 [Xanthomonadales bacterium]|nr:hypothetical protein [Xanthomonadales bacterium]MCB1595333.1 hypothetical protein [Xanthomonadales bacterium]
MNTTIILVILFFALCLYIGGCSVNGWQQQLDTDRDLPWCDVDTKVILETKQTSAPFSTTGYQTHWRWVTKTSRPNPSTYGRMIDKFFRENNYLEKWPKSGSFVGTDEGTKQLINAPYIIEFASVEPLVVFMRPEIADKDGIKYRPDLLTSQYLTNYYYYGTRFLYHSDTLWFSPDLNIHPQKLNLDKNLQVKINLGETNLLLKEQNGEVIITRELNN